MSKETESEKEGGGRRTDVRIVIMYMTKTPVVRRAKDATKIEGERVKVNVRKCGSIAR